MLSTSPDRGRVVVGGLLILVGVAVLAGQAFDVRLGERDWPYLVLLPGLGLLLVGLLLEGPGGVGLSIAGAITTMTGAVLLYQESTGAYASWSYAWALVAPGGVGLGMLLSGLAHGDRELTDGGGRVALIGVGLFVGFGVFFEGALGLSPDGGLFGAPLVPAALVLVGVLVILYAIVTAGRRGEA
jgi:hypothetical protein